MKKILNTILFLLLVNMAFAQAPQGIPYQAIARNSSGAILANQAIRVRFSIHDSIAGGTIVYQEMFTPTTNTLGLFNVNVGMGSVSIGTFSSINWGVNAKFMQVEMDPAGGTSYVDMGTTQMMSVPYALYAGVSNTSVFNPFSNIVVFDAVATINWTVPAGVNKIVVECWGGGGGRSGSSFGGFAYYSGGGGGGYAKSILLVNSGEVYHITVGGGGTNSNGSNSSFGDTIIVATGGSAGSSVYSGGSSHVVGGSGGYGTGQLVLKGKNGMWVQANAGGEWLTAGSGDAPIGGYGGDDFSEPSNPGGGGGGQYTSGAGAKGRVVISY